MGQVRKFFTPTYNNKFDLVGKFFLSQIQASRFQEIFRNNDARSLFLLKSKPSFSFKGIQSKYCRPGLTKTELHDFGF